MKLRFGLTKLFKNFKVKKDVSEITIDDAIRITYDHGYYDMMFIGNMGGSIMLKPNSGNVIRMAGEELQRKIDKLESGFYVPHK